MQKLKRLGLLKRAELTLSNWLLRADKPLALLAVLPKPLVTIVLIALCLLFFVLLSGCSPRTVKPSLPPQADQRPIPDFEGQTYRDVILYVIELREGFQSCEADKTTIRSLFGDVK